MKKTITKKIDGGKVFTEYKKGTIPKRVRKVPIKSITESHTNFAEEIATLDRKHDRMTAIIATVVAILGIILLIVNLTR